MTTPQPLDEPTHKATQAWLLEHLQQHTEAPYPSLPLDAKSQQIRLFRLEGGTGRLCGSLVVCSLQRYQEEQHGQDPIDDGIRKRQRNSQTQGPRPGFEALSYTWGESLHDEYVEVQDLIRIPITDNLARALRRLRHRTRPRDLWIDAVCVDQKNLEERSLQVAYMGEIYKRASRVIIWLGDYRTICLYSHGCFSL